MIYFDYAATTPMSDQSLEVYVEAAKDFYGNTMSLHDIGTKADMLVSACREQLATVIDGYKEGLYFTSGGSEGNFLAITSIARAHRAKGKHILTTPFEHPSVVSAIHFLEKEGYTYSYIPVNSDGLIRLDLLKEIIQEDTILVVIGHINGELGMIQPITQIGELLAEMGILFHIDAVQSFGKMSIDVQKSHISSLSISSHKLYGPKGVGACYIDPRIHWKPLLEETTHEQGFRQGTVNAPGIAAFITAMSDASNLQEHEWHRIYSLRQLMIKEIRVRQLPIVIEGAKSAENVLPHILPLRIPGIDGQLVMLESNRLGLAISTGTACKSGQSKPSKTLIAIGRTDTEAHEFIRLSFGKETTVDDIIKAVEILERVITSTKTPHI